jgi:hypothetical protein
MRWCSSVSMRPRPDARCRFHALGNAVNLPIGVLAEKKSISVRFGRGFKNPPEADLATGHTRTRRFFLS